MEESKNDNTHTNQDQAMELQKLGGSELSQTVKAFEELRKIAEYLATSETFTKGFETKDKDGKVITDPETGKPIINSADIAVCLMAGRELGLDITGSLMLGKKLSTNTYLSIKKGQELGLGIATCLEKMYTIDTKRGPISYTSSDIIAMKLHQAGITYLPFIKDYAPYYEYSVIKGVGADNKAILEVVPREEVLDDNDDVKSEFFVITPITKAEDLKTAKDAGKIMLQRREISRYTFAKFHHKDINGVEQITPVRYSLIDAQVAGLYPTKWDAEGNALNGKDNWAKNPVVMLRHRIIVIGGRLTGSTALNGIYSIDEAREIANDDNIPYAEEVK